MQADDGQAVVFGNPAQLPAPAGRQQLRLIAEGEGGQFDALIAKPGDQLALAGERQLAQDFVAERELHANLRNPGRSGPTDLRHIGGGSEMLLVIAGEFQAGPFDRLVRHLL